MTFRRPSCKSCGVVLVLCALVGIGLIASWVYWLSTQFEGDQYSLADINSYLGADRTPHWSPDGRYLVANAGKSIYYIGLPSGVTRRIGETNREQYSPALSSDGRIAFIEVNSKKGINRIMVTDIEGNRPRTVADWQHESPVEWSPDGSRLLYLRKDQDQVPAVVLYSPDEPEITWHARTETNTSAVWSPDSQKIAFHWERHHGSEMPYLIYMINRDGTGETVIDQSEAARYVRPEQGRPYYDSESRLSVPGWTEDNQLYYVEREMSEGQWQNILHVVSGDGRERRTIANLSRIAEVIERRFQENTIAAHKVRQVKPSPEGSRVLVFASNLLTNYRGETNHGRERLYILSLDTQSLEEIPTQGGYAGKLFASWSPNGEQVAVYDIRSGTLFTISADGSGVHVLLTDGDGLDLLRCC